MERAKHFYKKLFGLDVILDNGGNVILTEGLVLQDRNLWEQSIGQAVTPGHNTSALYFEERNIEAFAEKLQCYADAFLAKSEDTASIQYICPLTEIAPGRKILRFYDFDGNLIEVGTPWR